MKGSHGSAEPCRITRLLKSGNGAVSSSPGVMRSMINMYFLGLRDALAQEGNPEEVLLQRLPPTGYASWHGGSRESLETIRNRIVRVLKQNDSQAPRDEHAQRDALDQVPRDTLSSAPDDALRLLELAVPRCIEGTFPSM